MTHHSRETFLWKQTAPSTPSISESCWDEVDAIELGLGSLLSWQSVGFDPRTHLPGIVASSYPSHGEMETDTLGCDRQSNLLSKLQANERH